VGRARPLGIDSALANPYSARVRFLAVVAVVAVVACGDSRRAATDDGGRTPAPAGDAAPRPEGCERLPFADTLPVPEASGSAVLADGLLVVGDSGTRGAYVIVDPDSGDPIARGRLPLGAGAGDDLEGIAILGDQIVGVTSAGWMRHWRRVDDELELVDGPYPIAEVDDQLPLRPPYGGFGAPPTDSMACGAHGVNCGKNYEALCLGDAGGCAGWVGSKADGRLWCLELDGGRLRANRRRSIQVTGPDVLSGCDVDDAGVVWVATNGLDGRVLRVRDDQVAEAPLVSSHFTETIAVAPGGVVYLLGDSGDAPSDAERYRCR
jgi:hypothetical protein